MDRQTHAAGNSPPGALPPLQVRTQCSLGADAPELLFNSSALVRLAFKF